MLSRTQNRTLHTQISNHMQRTDRQLILQQRDTNLSISHPPQPIYSPIILSPSFASTPARTHSCALSITNCKKWVPQSWRARTDSSSATISGVWRSSLITPAALLLGFNGWVSLSNLFFFRWIRHCSAHFVWFVCLFWSYWRILLQFLAQHSMRFVFMAALFYSSFPLLPAYPSRYIVSSIPFSPENHWEIAATFVGDLELFLLLGDCPCRRRRWLADASCRSTESFGSNQ